MNSFVNSNFKTLYKKRHDEFELTRSLALLLVRNYIEKIVRKERGVSELANNASFVVGFTLSWAFNHLRIQQ